MAEERTTQARLRAIWDSTIGYHRLSAHFQPAIDDLLDLLEVEAGDRVLDVATGTGRAAVAAWRRGTKVTCQDISPVLLAEAEHFAIETGAADIEIDESDAEHLPYSDRSFDVVLSTFGLPHAPRADVALREMERVLRVGGRLGLVTWSHNAVAHELYRLFLPYRVPEPVEIPHVEWGRMARLREYFDNRSFPDLVHLDGTLTILYPDPESAWMDWARNYGPFRAAYVALESAEQEVVRKAAVDLLDRDHTSDGATVMRLPYLLTRADKAGSAGRLG